MRAKLLFLCLAAGLMTTHAASARPLSARVRDGAVRIAAIGDYGFASTAERDVSSLIRSWNPDAVLTLGDNNYPSGAAATIDANIGQYFADYIYPYTGQYTQTTGAPQRNRFYPVLGNHDWVTPGAQPYLDYFALPGNERYYTATLGAVEVFAIDSDPAEPDGIAATSKQALWLKSALGASRAAWRVVMFHHPPYSSGAHGNNAALQWPFAAWGADVVLAGHDHDYERILRDGIPYLVVGTGGAVLRPFGLAVQGSAIRFANDYGAMRIDADACVISLSFVTRAGDVIDHYTLPPKCAFAPMVAAHRWPVHRRSD